MGGGKTHQGATATATDTTNPKSDSDWNERDSEETCSQKRCCIKQRLVKAFSFLKSEWRKEEDSEKTCSSFLPWALPPLLLLLPFTGCFLKMLIFASCFSMLACLVASFFSMLAGIITKSVPKCIHGMKIIRKWCAEDCGIDVPKKESAPSCDEPSRKEPPSAGKRKSKLRKIRHFGVLILSVLAVYALSRGFSPAAVPLSDGTMGSTVEAALTIDDLNVFHDNQVELANIYSHLANTQHKLVSQQHAAVERLVLMGEQINKLTDRLHRAEMRLREKEEAIAAQHAVIEEFLLMGEHLEGRLELAERRLSGRDDSVRTTVKDRDSIDANKQSVGRRVQAMWSNGKYYPGVTTDVKIAANRKALYYVEFDDGDRAWIEGTKIQLIPDRA
uniref:BAHCC1-like Tudor domain-containing protein n=1 Tax=Lotharella oceanica TaxID=641309 RepID=A0A7S2TN67_9EUKA